MSEANEKGFLLSSETEGEDVYTKQGGLANGGGLVPGHAYSIIKTVEAKDVRLLNIRNPWGRFEWNGAWSDKDTRWTDEMKKIVKPVLDDKDGSFWMCIEDFVKNFVSINICMLKNWEEIRLTGKFIKVQQKDIDYVDDVISKFYYKFDAPSEMKIIIGIHQEDPRVLGSLKRPLLDVNYVLFKYDKKKKDISVYKTGIFKRERESQDTINVGKGSYILIPLTTGCMLQNPKNPKYKEMSIYVNNDEGGQELHPFVKSVCYDVYKKFGKQIIFLNEF